MPAIAEVKKLVNARKRRERWLHYHNNPEARRKEISKQLLLRDQLMRIWNGNVPHEKGISYNQRGKSAEHFILEELSRKGYTNLYDIADDAYAFPLDILGRKEGEFHGFLITTRFQARVTERTKRVARYFGVKLFIVHVKPDLSRYYIREVSEKVHYVPSYPMLKKDGLWPTKESV